MCSCPWDPVQESDLLVARGWIKTDQVLDQLLELFYIDIVSLALDGTLLFLGLCRLGATGDMRRHL